MNITNNKQNLNPSVEIYKGIKLSKSGYCSFESNNKEKVVENATDPNAPQTISKYINKIELEYNHKNPKELNQAKRKMASNEQYMFPVKDNHIVGDKGCSCICIIY